MRDFIICDSRQEFLSDIHTVIMMDSYPIAPYTTKDIEDALKSAKKKPNATVVIADNVITNNNEDILSQLPAKTVGFATTPNGNNIINSAGLNSIGLYQTSEQLVEALCNDPLEIVSYANKTNKTMASATNKTNTASTTSKNGKNNQPNTTKKESSKPKEPVYQTENDTEDKEDLEDKKISQNSSSGNKYSGIDNAANGATNNVANNSNNQQDDSQTLALQEQLLQMQQIILEMQKQQNQQINNANSISSNAPSNTPKENLVDEANNEDIEDVEDVEDFEDDFEPEQPKPAQVEKKQKQKKKVDKAGDKMRAKKKIKEEIQADEELDELLAFENEKTKVISVYAAKGGVGKTSISTELAVCLALTSNGRRKFRVCIVDYNIDFGDVATTLNLRDDGPNISYWASEIRDMLARGDNPENINFSRDDMENLYLQEMRETGLYALCAPIAHEDSMLIKPTELQIMLRNIIENGEFDFVICDTGNNTRDSSIIAIDNSDYILLVATQDVTTANCNASVIHTLENSGFETDKIRLIVNNIMPPKETGISVQEVEETFPYQCICRIKRTPDIIKANNLSKPLVYKPNHDYTKQIQKIVRFVTAGEIVKDEPKKGLFSFLRRN
jgi:MinD-like ATPase involved in chromosome partitioning or flagellar assembly